MESDNISLARVRKKLYIHDNAFKMSSYQILHTMYIVLECDIYSNKCVNGFIN